MTVTDTIKPSVISLATDEAHALALQCHRNGLVAEAEMLYRRILAVRQDATDILHLLAGVCHQQQRPEEALELIDQVLALEPANADAHNNKGNMLEGLGRSGEAEACYRAALVANPDHAPAHNNLGVMLLAQLQADEAIDHYRRAVELAPEAADYRYNLGNALRKKGDLQEAVEAYKGALARNQHHSGAWQGLTRCYLLAERRDLAREAYEEWLKVETDNPGISFLLSACTGEGVPPRAPESFVSTMFDTLADSFDTHLAHLEYRAPELLCEALGTALGHPDSALDILDAGCGTGLCGPLLKPFSRSLGGVDLSAGMLARAAARNVYDDLRQGELTAFIGSHPGGYDAIVSADTLCYFGDLNPVFAASAAALRPSGYLAFTLEDASDGEEPKLNVHGRYMHPWGYVVRELAENGFTVHSSATAVLRNEGGVPVAGHVVVARKP